jgi:hypothetical protein
MITLRTCHIYPAQEADLSTKLKNYSRLPFRLPDGGRDSAQKGPPRKAETFLHFFEDF